LDRKYNWNELPGAIVEDSVALDDAQVDDRDIDWDALYVSTRDRLRDIFKTFVVNDNMGGMLQLEAEARAVCEVLLRSRLLIGPEDVGYSIITDADSLSTYLCVYLSMSYAVPTRKVELLHYGGQTFLNYR
jgi:hypothetical protein